MSPEQLAQRMSPEVSPSTADQVVFYSPMYEARKREHTTEERDRMTDLLDPNSRQVTSTPLSGRKKTSSSKSTSSSNTGISLGKNPGGYCPGVGETGTRI